MEKQMDLETEIEIIQTKENYADEIIEDYENYEDDEENKTVDIEKEKEMLDKRIKILVKFLKTDNDEDLVYNYGQLKTLMYKQIAKDNLDTLVLQRLQLDGKTKNIKSKDLKNYINKL